MKTRIPVIGLTGPMCAGKNEAAAILEKEGFHHIDADKIAHKALEQVKDQVLAAFSGEARARSVPLVSPDGSLDRRALGSLLFADQELLSRHERIIFPKISELIMNEIEGGTCKDSAEGSCRGVILNAPTLHKAPVLLDRCSFVLYIDAPACLRLIRAIRRDNMPIRLVLQRFSAQKHLFSQYLSKNVDIVRVHNRASVRALERKLVQLLSLKGY